MRRQHKKKASNGTWMQTLLALQHNAVTLKGSLPFVNSYCNKFLHCVVKRLGVLLMAWHAKSCISFMRYLNNAEFKAINYSKS